MHYIVKVCITGIEVYIMGIGVALQSDKQENDRLNKPILLRISRISTRFMPIFPERNKILHLQID